MTKSEERPQASPRYQHAAEIRHYLKKFRTFPTKDNKESTIENELKYNSKNLDLKLGHQFTQIKRNEEEIIKLTSMQNSEHDSFRNKCSSEVKAPTQNGQKTQETMNSLHFSPESLPSQLTTSLIENAFANLCRQTIDKLLTTAMKRNE